MTNAELIEKSAIQTSSLSDGILNPSQARKFITQTFEATNLGKLIRHETVTSQTGELDKIGIGKRIVRKKTEGTDDGYRASVQTSKIEYAVTPVRVPWEITEEALRQNIEGESLEAKITYLMTTQIGCDNEDLYLNGDTSTASTDPDYDFLKINDGWIKQINANGHVYDATSDTHMTLDMFYAALQSLPNKYNDGSLRWLMSPKRAQEWALYLMKQVLSNGGALPENIYSQPAAIPVIQCPSMSDDKILLTNPKNLIVANSYNVKIRKTDQGKEAIMQDKRFYVVHYDYDPVIEELDATAIIKNLPAISAGA